MKIGIFAFLLLLLVAFTPTKQGQVDTQYRILLEVGDLEEGKTKTPLALTLFGKTDKETFTLDSTTQTYTTLGIFIYNVKASKALGELKKIRLEMKPENESPIDPVYIKYLAVSGVPSKKSTLEVTFNSWLGKESAKKQVLVQKVNWQ
jgi:hypothetical protein